MTPDRPAPTGVVVRPAERRDLPHLPDLEVAAGARFRAVGMDAVADDEPPPDAEYAAALGNGLLWVAADADDEAPPVGYAWAVELDGQPHLEQLSVHPDHGGRGIGTALLDVVVDWATTTGAGSLTLSTFRDVPWNGPWYGRRGFVVVPTVSLDERLEAVRRHEEERGLDTGSRVIMRLGLDPA